MRLAILAGLGFLGLSPAMAAAQPAMLSAVDLNRFLDIARAFKPVDAFSAPLDESPVLGRRFRISGPIRSGDSTGSAGDALGFWTYDVRSQTLRLVASVKSFPITPLIASEPAIYDGYGGLNGFEIRSTRSSDGSYVASNAYGATVTVERATLTINGVAVFSPSSSNSGLPGGERTSYSHSWQVPADEARRVTNTARVVVEGVVEPFAPGRATLCYRDYWSPTVQSPKATALSRCVISVRVDTVSITDGEGGPVLATWK